VGGDSARPVTLSAIILPPLCGARSGLARWGFAAVARGVAGFRGSVPDVRQSKAPFRLSLTPVEIADTIIDLINSSASRFSRLLSEVRSIALLSPARDYA